MRIRRVLFRTDDPNVKADSMVSGKYTLTLPGDQVIRHTRGIRVGKVSIPNGSYRIITGKNDTLTYTQGGGPISVVIPAGQYSGSSLATALQTALGGGWTVSYSSITNKITISNAGAFIIKGTSTCLLVLGFTPGTDTGSATSQTSPNIVNLGSLDQWLYICSSELYDNNYYYAGVQGISDVICVKGTTDFGTTEYIESEGDKNNPDILFCTPKNTEKFDIFVAFMDGTRFIPNGAVIMIEIMFYFDE